MHDPTDPTNAPELRELRGIHEFDVSIPFTRQKADGLPEAMHVVVRIPAATIRHAYTLAVPFGDHIAAEHETDGERWRPLHAQTTAVCVDDMPSPAEVAAERDHWRRVVAALAGKFPGLLQLTEPEYAAADPASIVASRMDDVMVFLSPASFGPPPAELFSPPEPAAVHPVPDGMESPGVDPKIELPTARDLVNLPANPGGHTDPDVRRVAASTLARANAGELEILSAGEWRRLDSAMIDHEQGEVQILAAGLTIDPVDADRGVLTRPATSEGYASDLPTAAIAGQQLLTAQGWMTVATADDMGAFSGHAVKASLVGESGSSQTSFNAGDPLLLRVPRPGWWV